MLKESTILNKLKELKEAAWNYPYKERAREFTIADTRSRRFAKKYADKTSKLIKEGVQAVGEEAGETEQMARSFFKLLEAKLDLSGRKDPPSEEEVKAAIEQLKDVGRFSIFTTLVILPGGVVSLLGLERVPELRNVLPVERPAAAVIVWVELLRLPNLRPWRSG